MCMCVRACVRVLLCVLCVCNIYIIYIYIAYTLLYVIYIYCIYIYIYITHFGFKSAIGCPDIIFSLKSVINNFVQRHFHLYSVAGC